MKETYLLAIKLYEASVRVGAPSDVCQCCGAHVAEGVKGCFALYADMSAQGYADPTYGTVAFYGVDAHALQHPEIHGKKNNAAHLLRLHWIFSRQAYRHAATVPKWWQQYLQGQDIPSLAPPPLKLRGQLTVVEIAAALGTPAFAEAMKRWAQEVYVAWQVHHAWAESELQRILK